MDKQVTFQVVAVGTENGRSVLFLTRKHPQGGIEQKTVPTDLKHMVMLAEMGVRVRNA